MLKDDTIIQLGVHRVEKANIFSKKKKQNFEENLASLRMSDIAILSPMGSEVT